MIQFCKNMLTSWRWSFPFPFSFAQQACEIRPVPTQLQHLLQRGGAVLDGQENPISHHRSSPGSDQHPIRCHDLPILPERPCPPWRLFCHRRHYQFHGRRRGGGRGSALRRKPRLVSHDMYRLLWMNFNCKKLKICGTTSRRFGP